MLGESCKPEREELNAVLRSGIFSRSPSLEQFLVYVCRMYFEGRACEIKEYNVAVEALGRTPDFDQKKDSIVRVEAHRMRKRLREYYRQEGASHALQITIPPGCYAPQFLLKSEITPATSTADTVEFELAATPPRAVSTPVPAALVAAPAAGNRWSKLALIACAMATVAFVAYYFMQRAEARDRIEPPISSPVAVAQPEVRISAGRPAKSLVDVFGNSWSVDRDFSGGDALRSSPRPVRLTRDNSLYLDRREGEFSYDVPLNPGSYELRLHFAETVFGENNDGGGGESSRVFKVLANGRQIWMPADVIADAGGSNTADIKVFKDITPAPDGKLHLEFKPLHKEVAFVNAIEILPTAAGHMRPVRLLPREKSWLDSRSVEWSSDRYYVGGQVVARHESVAGASEQELYRNERFGNFSYVIPVAEKSRYTVTLRFAEHWFGPGRNGAGGEGSRLFDVYCGGKTLLRNFDVYREAGGSVRAIERTFRGLEPNAQGKLKLDFVPVSNYALINAIEVIDEGQK